MPTDRKTEILRAAIELIADEGYGSLSMRALARASGMKLGALQYHFRTWDALLVALVTYIESEIVSAFESGVGELDQVSVRDMIAFMLDEHVGTADGRRLEFLNVIDEQSRLCLAIRMSRRYISTW